MTDRRLREITGTERVTRKCGTAVGSAAAASTPIGWTRPRGESGQAAREGDSREPGKGRWTKGGRGREVEEG